MDVSRAGKDEVDAAAAAEGPEGLEPTAAAAGTERALERAAAAHADPQRLSGAVTNLIESLLDVGIDGRGRFTSARDFADAMRARSSDAEEAVVAAVRGHLKLAAAGGFVTGVGGFITLPVALPANVIEFYIVATRMVASIASLRGHDLSRPEIRSAVLLTLVGADSEDLLGKAGVARTGRLSNLAAQRLPGPALMVVNKAVGFRLLTVAGRSTLSRFGKGLPVIGGALGAALDSYLLMRIADHARREFPPAG